MQKNDHDIVQLAIGALQDRFIPASTEPFKFLLSFSDDKERILIGPYDKIARYLSGESVAAEENTDIVNLLNDFLKKGIYVVAKSITTNFMRNVYHYNNISVFNVREFPVGSFLINFERDDSQKWKHAIYQFRSALFGRGDRKAEQNAISFLLERYNSYDLVCQYVVVSMIRYYFYALTMPLDQRADSYEKQMTLLARAFWTIGDPPTPGPVKNNSGILRIPLHLFEGEHTAQTWFTPSSHGEYIFLERSFFPLKAYYVNHLHKLGLSLQRCKQCKRYFFVKTMKTELCSDECRKMSRQKSDQKYYEDELNRINKNAHQAWRNRIGKAFSSPDIPASILSELNNEYADHKERTQKKLKELKDKYSAPPGEEDEHSQELRLKQMVTELLTWHEKELEIAKGIMGKFEARIPRELK